MRSLVFIYLLTGLLFSHPNNSINYTPSVHNRFYQEQDRNFWAERFDFSGVGFVSGRGPWGTMITEHAFVTANHYKPNIGSLLKFYPYNTTTVVWTGKVVWTKNIYGDCTIGMLEEAPPSNIKRYPVISKGGYYNWTEATNMVYVGRVNGAFAVGTTAIGYNVNPPGEITEQWIPLTGFIWDNGGWEWVNDHYTYATDFDLDSGAPTLMFDDQNRLSLVGTHYTQMGDGFYGEHADKIDAELQLSPIWPNEKVMRFHELLPSSPTNIEIISL